MSVSLCCLSETNSRTVRAWLDRSKGWQKGKQLHPKPESCQIWKLRRKTKGNEEVYKIFGSKNKLCPASMEAMIRLHLLFKFLDLLKLPGKILGQNNNLKKPKKNQNKQTKTHKNQTNNPGREEGGKHGCAWHGVFLVAWYKLEFPSPQAGFLPHNVCYTAWVKWLKFLFPCQGKSPEISDQGTSLSQMGCFDSICWIHLLIPLARTVHYLPTAVNFLTAKLAFQLFILPEYKLIHIQVLRLWPQIKKLSTLQ